MKFLGKVDMIGNEVANMVISADDSGILHAKAGRIARKDGRLFMGAELVSVDGNEIVFIPLLQERNTHQHDQSAPAAVWTIVHNMNSTRVIVQPWPNGSVAIPESIEAIDNDTVRVTFNEPCTGFATVMVGNIDGMQKPDVRYEHPFADVSVITVDHSLGYNPAVRVLNEFGFELLDYTMSNPTVNRTVLTFSRSVSGTVYCL